MRSEDLVMMAAVSVYRNGVVSRSGRLMVRDVGGNVSLGVRVSQGRDRELYGKGSSGTDRESERSRAFC